MDAVGHGVALEAGGGDNGVVSLAVGGQLLGGGPDQQVVDEQVLRSQLVDDAELLGVLGVGAGKAVEDEDLVALEISGDLAHQSVKALLGDGAVDLAPGDVVMDGGGVHDELVVRGTAGVLAGGDHQGAGIAELALAAAKSSLNQLGGAQVPIDSTGIQNTQLFKTKSFHR